jgi:hypothetical protein
VVIVNDVVANNDDASYTNSTGAIKMQQNKKTVPTTTIHAPAIDYERESLELEAQILKNGTIDMEFIDKQFE